MSICDVGKGMSICSTASSELKYFVSFPKPYILQNFLEFADFLTLTHVVERREVNADIVCYQLGYVTSGQIQMHGENRNFFCRRKYLAQDLSLYVRH